MPGGEVGEGGRGSDPPPRAGVAGSGAGVPDWGAGAQQAVAPQSQHRHEVTRAVSDGASQEVNARPAGEASAWARKARRRSSAGGMRVMAGPGERLGPRGAGCGVPGYFLAAASSFLANLAVSFLKSFRQPLQQNWYSRPSTTAPTALPSSSASSETMHWVSG